MVVGDDGLVDDEVVVVGLHQNAVFCFFKWSIPGLIFFILRLICPLSFGTKPGSSGYGRNLMFQRSLVQFPASYAGWTFFISNCCKNCNVCLKRRKINKKEAMIF